MRWHFGFQLRLRDIEELLFEHGVTVSDETIRRWREKFGAGFAQRVKAAPRKPGVTRHLDQVFVTLRGEPYLLWRAVDELGANSMSCCRSVATRLQPGGFSSAC